MRKIKKTRKTKKRKRCQFGKGNQSIRCKSKNNCTLDVIYNNISINGQKILKNKTRIEPKINFNAEEGILYVLVMWDPDAPQSSWVHWIESYIKIKNVLQKSILLDYQGPNPPSGTHHYYFSLYRKNKKEEIKDIPEQRGYFDIKQFEQNNNLEKICEVCMLVSKYINLK